MTAEQGDWIKLRGFFEDEWFRVELGTFGRHIGYHNHKAGCYGESDISDVIAIRKDGETD